MTTRPISFDKNQSLDRQALQLAGFLSPNRLQLGRVKSRHQILSTGGSSDRHPQPQYEE